MLSLTIGKADQGMDWLQWTASIVGSIAWPVAVVVVAYFFRKELTALLKRLTELTWGDKSAKFTTDLDRIENEALANTKTDVVPAIAESAPLPAEADADGDVGIADAAVAEVISKQKAAETVAATNLARPLQWQKMLEISPNVAVLESWREIEARIDNLVAKLKGPADLIATWKGRVQFLVDARLIDVNLMRMLLELRSLRNQAAHDQRVSEADAARFKFLSDKAIQELELARGSLYLG